MNSGKKITQLCGWIIFILAITIPVVRGGSNVPAVSEKVESGGIILIRHGEGEHNVEGVLNSQPGHTNYTTKHLTALGREQTRATAEQLQEQGISGEKICQVLVSPLPRTQETASTLMGSMQIASSKKLTVDGLIENSAGDREGRKHDEFGEEDFWFAKNPESFGGETVDEVIVRTRQVITDILNNSGCDLQSEYVLLVSHGMPIYVMLDLLTGKPEKIDPASFRVIHNPVLRIEN